MTGNRGYVPTIGLEVHAQLATESKMFCGCSAKYSGASPNTHVCPVDLGLPGALPVINAQALEYGIMAALAMSCTVAEHTRFDRKNYPYPDIPKGYQISQYASPVGSDGHVDIEVDGETQRIGIIRAHLEEDTGKTVHATIDGREISLVDFNRSGVPLLEIVSQPDLRSAEAARAYFMTLREILVFIGVSNGDLQHGDLRADVNVSVVPPGNASVARPLAGAETAGNRAEPRGTKVEIKNLNSYRSVAAAVEFEIERQIGVLESGGLIVQETRGWDDAREVTVGQRTKEHAEDYRYFPEPDLPPLRLSHAQVEAIKASMPELASAKRERFVTEYGLSPYDVGVLTQDPALAGLFDDTVIVTGASQAKSAANWLAGEYLRLLGESDELKPQITGAGLAAMLSLISKGTITNAAGKTVFEEMFRTGTSPESIVAERNLAQIGDRDELESIVRRVLDENPALADEYINKDRKTEGPLVGKVMAATRAAANAATVKEILASLLLPKAP